MLSVGPNADRLPSAQNICVKGVSALVMYLTDNTLNYSSFLASPACSHRHPVPERVKSRSRL
jgi:hypothetical protein